MQVEAAGLRADLLALRQFHLRSRALSTVGSEAGSWGSDEEEEDEALSEAYRPSRQSRYAVATHGTACCTEYIELQCISQFGQNYLLLTDVHDVTAACLLMVLSMA